MSSRDKSSNSGGGGGDNSRKTSANKARHKEPASSLSSSTSTKLVDSQREQKAASKKQPAQQEKGKCQKTSSRRRRRNEVEQLEEDTTGSALNLNEMAAKTTSTATPSAIGGGGGDVGGSETEQETNVDGGSRRLSGSSSSSSSTLDGNQDANANKEVEASGSKPRDELAKEPPLPAGWEQHIDKSGLYYWHVATGVIQRTRPEAGGSPPRRTSLVFYHDDEEINQVTTTTTTHRTSSEADDDDFYDGAALTLDDEETSEESTFVVYPLGCCEFDETQLVAATSSKAIQKCILRLSNRPRQEERVCWGLDQSQPILMKLFDDHIQFTDLSTQSLLRSQPIQTIKSWAVDDDNNFAFVIEDRPASQQQQLGHQTDDYFESVEHALLDEPCLMCYVFRSMDDDDMSCKVAAKLNEEISRYKEHMQERLTKSTRLQQMVAASPSVTQLEGEDDDGEFDDDDELEANNELTMNVKYIGSTPVPRPTGIDVLNVAIDKCLAEASRAQINNTLSRTSSVSELEEVNFSPLIEAKLHISPSSVIVENVVTGEIIVECRIRYLTFMGISKRDIRWCGFLMQNSTNKTFVAHCFECHPTAGHVCEAIQLSCTRMYEKVVKNAKRQEPETMSIIPTRSKIRNTLAKTFSRIKLNPIK